MASVSHGIHTIHILTEHDGYNSGRAYYLRAESNEITDCLLAMTQEQSNVMRNRMASRNIWQHTQRLLNNWLHSKPAQFFIIAMIVLNFGVTVLQTQFINETANKSSSQAAGDFGVLADRLNIGFVLVFMVELVVNAIANWYTPFVSDPWNLFDAFVIVSSLFLAVIPGQSVGLKTSLQAGRVIRILGKVDILRQVAVGPLN
mmetsp:Transcript_60655/g.161979  ORF Transcript_60655/g.161979 Transcript_60655/m.161979 type:complete len:202 (+) Transcript_60655:397-1002(+)